jgi:galactitol-specific phosphotransferase system IIB component
MLPLIEDTSSTSVAVKITSIMKKNENKYPLFEIHMRMISIAKKTIALIVSTSKVASAKDVNDNTLISPPNNP